ncbi:MASE1 domain-containing protein [Bradyrhizobium sp. USDA 4522]
MDKAGIFAFGDARSAVTYSVEVFIVTAIYGSLAASAHFLPAINPTATPLWPPTGVALALMLLRGYRIWPAILLGAVAPYLMTDRSLLELVAAGIGTLLAALAGTWLIGRWSNGCQTFATPSGVAKFAGISFAPTAMISSFTALAGSIFVNEPSFSRFRRRRADLVACRRSRDPGDCSGHRALGDDALTDFLQVGSVGIDRSYRPRWSHWDRGL